VSLPSEVSEPLWWVDSRQHCCRIKKTAKHVLLTITILIEGDAAS